LEAEIMLVAIVETGTGEVPTIVIAAGADVATAISIWTNSYSPPLNPSNYIGVDTGWPGPGAEEPAPGNVWGVNRDTDTLVQIAVAIPVEFGQVDIVSKSGIADETLPAARTASSVRRIDYTNNTPTLTIKRSVGDTINGNAVDLVDLPDGTYEAIPESETDWHVRALATRSFDAVVRADGTGDYTSVSDALAAGAKSVFITSGTYVETGSMVLPEDAALLGESPGSVVLALVANNPITFTGVGRHTNTGTITVTGGTSSVIGVGTTFTAVQDGDYILIGSSWYSIGSVTDDTSMVLEDVFNGATYAGSFVAQSMVTGATLRNLIVTASPTHGIVIDQGFHVALQNCLVIRCGTNGTDSSFKIDKSSEVHAIGFVVEHAGAAGVEVIDSTLIRLETNAVKNSAGHGIDIKGSIDVSLDAIMSMTNGDCGVAIDSGCARTGLSECMINQNALHGIVAGGPGTIVGGCSCYQNGGDGIRVGAVANVMVDGNLCQSNVGGGLNITAGATDALATSNNLLGNTGTNFVDAGTGTTAANNKM
jgi:hypothetical protein